MSRSLRFYAIIRAMTRVVVVTSCTGAKAYAVGEGPIAAEDLYTGEQHVRLMRGVRAYRAAGEPVGRLDLRIVSAGLGLLSAGDMVRGYERTFATMTRREARQAAIDLGIPQALRDALAPPLRLGLLLLGEDYLRACALPNDLAVGGPVVAIVGSSSARLVPPAFTLAATGIEDTRRFHAGFTALKGEIGGRALRLLAREPSAAGRLAAGDLSMLHSDLT